MGSVWTFRFSKWDGVVVFVEVKWDGGLSFQTTFGGCIRILVSDKYPDNVGFENPTYVFGFVRGLSPRYVCCVQTGRRFKFSDDLWAVGRILVSDKYPDNVGFENPTYVFGFVRGLSPRYVCCVQTGRRFKFSDDLWAVGRILVSDKYPDNVGFENPTYVFGFVRGQSPRYV